MFGKGYDTITFNCLLRYSPKFFRKFLILPDSLLTNNIFQAGVC